MRVKDLLIEFEELEERLRDILASQEKGTKMIDIAKALGISAQAYYRLKNKNKNKLIFKIILFLAQKDLPINLILFNQTNRKIQRELNKYPMLKHIQTDIYKANKKINRNNTS